MSTPTLIPCPICTAPVEWGPQSPHRPFCCERCKLIDLGAWAAEEHVIAGCTLEYDQLSEHLPPRQH
jgi:endogenous inhibitor of DNA gyrase (YacG/DUF329 family)